MKTIKNNITNELAIKNSKFITLLYNINSEEEFHNILKNVKAEYKNATHYCYAYILEDTKRSSDDGEPSGTAGIPILNVLEKNNLTNILCIVVRYFGGIKLGAGGLIRAYGKSVRDALLISNLIQINECYKVTFTFTYDDLKKIDSIIRNSIIIDKTFDENIKYTVLIKNDQLDIIEKLKLAKVNIISIKKDYYIE